VIRDIADNIFPPRSTSTWTSPELTYPQTRTAAHPPLFTLLFHRSLQLNRNRNPNLHPYPSDPHNLAHSFPCSIAPSLPHLLHRYLTYSTAPSLAPPLPHLLGRRPTAYFVAFGPHGPRTPTNPPGHSMRVLGGVGAAVLAAIGILTFARTRCTWLLSALYSLLFFPDPIRSRSH
jgi:hypothetical protein